MLKRLAKFRGKGDTPIKKAAKGGSMAKQMEMFEEGGLKEEGGMIDEESGNDVPIGSTKEEVRDDIPAQLSEGEFVFPADVVRFIGLEKLMMMRQEAKAGLKRMEEMGQMGNSEEATMPDDMPFDINDLDMEDEREYNRDSQEMNQGGMVRVGGKEMPKPRIQGQQFADGGVVAMQEGGEPSIDPANFPVMDGQIDGPGTETSDDIPAMLSDGEFVMTAKAVKGAGSFDVATNDSNGIVTLTPNGDPSRDSGTRVMYKLMEHFGSMA